jgi:hypothetical protein
MTVFGFTGSEIAWPPITRLVNWVPESLEFDPLAFAVLDAWDFNAVAEIVHPVAVVSRQTSAASA